MKKYYVGSNGDAPLKIMFDEIDAFVSGYEYLDVFDESGDFVELFQLVDGEYV